MPAHNRLEGIHRSGKAAPDGRLILIEVGSVLGHRNPSFHPSVRSDTATRISVYFMPMKRHFLPGALAVWLLGFGPGSPLLQVAPTHPFKAPPTAHETRKLHGRAPPGREEER